MGGVRTVQNCKRNASESFEDLPYSVVDLFKVERPSQTILRVIEPDEEGYMVNIPAIKSIPVSPDYFNKTVVFSTQLWYG